MLLKGIQDEAIAGLRGMNDLSFPLSQINPTVLIHQLAEQVHHHYA